MDGKQAQPNGLEARASGATWARDAVGPPRHGVVAARRRWGWRAPAAAWAAGGIGMLVLEWIVSNEDQVFIAVLTLVMVGLVRLGHALGAVRLAASPAK